MRALGSPDLAERGFEGARAAPHEVGDDVDDDLDDLDLGAPRADGGGDAAELV